MLRQKRATFHKGFSPKFTKYSKIHKHVISRMWILKDLLLPFYVTLNKIRI